MTEPVVFYNVNLCVPPAKRAFYQLAKKPIFKWTPVFSLKLSRILNCQEKLPARNICREDRHVADSTFSREGIFAEARFSIMEPARFSVVFI